MKTLDLGSDCSVCSPLRSEPLRCAMTWPRRFELWKCLAVEGTVPDVKGFESRERRSMSCQSAYNKQVCFGHSEERSRKEGKAKAAIAQSIRQSDVPGPGGVIPRRV